MPIKQPSLEVEVIVLTTYIYLKTDATYRLMVAIYKRLVSSGLCWYLLCEHPDLQTLTNMMRTYVRSDRVH